MLPPLVLSPINNILKHYFTKCLASLHIYNNASASNVGVHCKAETQQVEETLICLHCEIKECAWIIAPSKCYDANYYARITIKGRCRKSLF